MSTGKRRQKRRAPRRLYTGPELLRAAFLAGQGCSGEEIAGMIGRTTGPKIRARLRRAGITMVRRGRTDAVLTLSLPAAHLSAFEAIADVRETDPMELARAIFARLAAKPSLIDQLADRVA